VRRRSGRIALVAGVLTIALGGQAFVGDAEAGAGTTTPTLRAPLASALSSQSGSWAVVAMGQRGHPLNTFWELFFRVPTAATWRLVTPPGVADNGGLTVSVTPAGSALVGFEPSQLLRYSPAAVSHNDGAGWDPALVPVSLAAVPDALTIASSGSGTALALVRRGSGELLTSSGSLLDWRPLPGVGSTGRGADARCGHSGLDAVALNSSSDAMLGTGCRRAGQIGIFSLVGGHWQLDGPSLHGSLAHATTRVLRLNSSGLTTTALVAEERHHQTGLLGLWRSATGIWTQTLPLSLGASTTVLATAAGASGQQLVLLKNRGSSDSLEETAGPDRPWVGLPTPPAGTVTVAPLSDGGANAFSVAGSRLRVFTLTPQGGKWVLSQHMNVPIAYGSS
jgi:hypothetical protein